MRFNDPLEPGRAKGELCGGTPGVVGALLEPGLSGDGLPMLDVEGLGCCP